MYERPMHSQHVFLVRSNFNVSLQMFNRSNVFVNQTEPHFHARLNKDDVRLDPPQVLKKNGR